MELPKAQEFVIFYYIYFQVYLSRDEENIKQLLAYYAQKMNFLIRGYSIFIFRLIRPLSGVQRNRNSFQYTEFYFSFYFCEQSPIFQYVSSLCFTQNRHHALLKKMLQADFHLFSVCRESPKLLLFLLRKNCCVHPKKGLEL